MSLYTILFGLSLFLIALVLAIIKNMFFQWTEEHKKERTVPAEVDTSRSAVSMIIYVDKCVVRRRTYAGSVNVFDVITKSDLSLSKKDDLREIMYHKDLDTSLDKIESSHLDLNKR